MEDVRKYSFVKVLDPQRYLFVHLLTVFATVPQAENPEVVTNIVQKLAALLAPFSISQAMQAQALLKRRETEAAARSSDSTAIATVDVPLASSGGTLVTLRGENQTAVSQV